MYVKQTRIWIHHGRNDVFLFFLDLRELDRVAVHHREQQQIQTHLRMETHVDTW